MRVLVLNGPNLNLLGTREPEVYGNTTLADLEGKISSWAGKLGVEASFHQSNHEGALVDAIQSAAGVDGIVINPGALTHTSRSIGDAIRAVGAPAVEVHISNVKDREPWRAVSLVSDACALTIYGRGFEGYRDALRHLVNRAAMPFVTSRYGPHPDNVADLRDPDEAKGLVLLVHGGFWRRPYERDGMESIAVDLGRRGFSTLNLEYRRLGAGGGWPGSAHDVLSALSWARQTEGLAALPSVMIGHSAGGQMALWAATRPSDRPIDLVVGLGAVTDLRSLADSAGNGSLEAGLLLERGAPATVHALPGKTLLVHGADDDLVPLSHATSLRPEAEILVVEGMGHFSVLDPEREHWPPVVAAIEAAVS